jgi:methylmalonyl-CoA mutase
MIGLKQDFPIPSLEEWQIQLTKELKGEDPSVLERHDEIEGIKYATYQYDLGKNSSEGPRRGNSSRNDWHIATQIEVHDEKSTNEKVIELLMTGCDEPIFDFRTNESADLDLLFKGIEFQYIHTTIVTNSIETVSRIQQSLGSSYHGKFKYAIDPHVVGLDPIRKLALLFSEKQTPFIVINAYGLQQTGANATQELAFSLSTANECLGVLLEAGMNIDQAAACIHFSVGITANYFYSIAKIRALKELWSSIVDAYSPIHSCSKNCVITAVSGPMNKSLKDPYTNLLRQTTEGLSAAVAGVDSLLIHPYTCASSHPSLELAERMATNISLLLKEESYLHSVNDPMGGSYAIEQLTTQFSGQAWDLFQETESKNGVFTTECAEFIQALIRSTAKQRLTLLRDGKNLLIGVNKFANPSPEIANYADALTYFGLPHLILERELMTEKNG